MVRRDARQGIGVEVLLETERVRAVLVGSGEEVDQHLARSRDFTQPGRRLPVAGIAEREVHQLERPVERALRHVWIARGPANRPAYLAAHMAQLIEEGQRPPSSLGQFAMLRPGHRRTSRATRSAIAVRVAGSSTERDRLPNDGRRLIMESNSSQSFPGRSGYKLMPHRSR